jgi:hypothetical protein
VRLTERINRLHFHDELTFYEQIQEMVADRITFVDDLNEMLDIRSQTVLSESITSAFR